MRTNGIRLSGVIHWVVAVLFLLVSAGAPGLAQARDKNAELIDAVGKHDVEKAMALLESGANVNALHGGPLGFASVRGDLKMMKLLLRKGADPNGKGILGLPLVIEASAICMPEVVALLLEAGADVNAKTAYNETPLKVARGRKRQEIEKILKARGAKE
jgi:ankyrin repeat protein